jgi:acetolactate synthase I/II/III large subunit
LRLTADGSGIYALQALLWTVAREGFNVTTVVFANHSYAVLKHEFSYLGVGNPGTRALDMFEIGRPDLDRVSGERNGSARQADRFGRCFRESATAGLEGEGPTLIEVPL